MKLKFVSHYYFWQKIIIIAMILIINFWVNNAIAAVEKVDEASFKAKVLQAKDPVWVEFWAEWCGPCKELSSMLDRIAGECSVQIFKLNIDENPDRTARYGIRAIPALLLFEDGKIVNNRVGMMSEAKLRELLNCFAVYGARPDVR